MASAVGCGINSAKTGASYTEFGLHQVSQAGQYKWASNNIDTNYSCLESFANQYKAEMRTFWGGVGFKKFGVGIGNPGHNCTLFAAYMLSKNGYVPSSVALNQQWGNASEWGKNLPRILGVKAYDSKPAVGSIAWASGGHVAYVYKVIGNTVFTYSDNYSEITNYGWTSRDERPISYWSGFLHIKDIPTGPSAVPSGTSNGGVKISNPTSGLCVDVPLGLAWGEGFSEPARATQLYTCNGTAAQQWLYDPGSQSIRVYADPNVRCLDIAGGSETNGTKVQVWQCNNTNAQKWSLLGDGTIRSSKGYCLDAKDRGTISGTTLQIWQCSSGAGNQKWLTSLSSKPSFSGFSAVVVSGGGNIRNQPSTVGAVLKFASGGSSLTIICQTSGQTLYYGNTPLAIWDKTSEGGFIWDGLIKNTAVMTWDTRIPRC